MSALQEDDHIHPANQLPMSSLQADGQAQPQAAYGIGIHPPPDALSKTAPGPVPIRDPVYVTPLERLLETPADIDCPFCDRRTRTQVVYRDSSMTEYITHATPLSPSLWILLITTP